MAAYHLARRAFEVDELLEFVALLEEVDEAGRLDMPAVLIDDRAHVILLLRRGGGAREPRRGILGAGGRHRGQQRARDQRGPKPRQRRGSKRSRRSVIAPLRPPRRRYGRPSVPPADTARRYGPTP